MVSEKTSSEKLRDLLEAAHPASAAARTGIQVCSGPQALGHAVLSLRTDLPAHGWGSTSHAHVLTWAARHTPSLGSLRVPEGPDRHGRVPDVVHTDKNNEDKGCGGKLRMWPRSLPEQQNVRQEVTGKACPDLTVSLKARVLPFLPLMRGEGHLLTKGQSRGRAGLGHRGLAKCQACF